MGQTPSRTQIRSNGLAPVGSHPQSSESQPSFEPSTSLLTTSPSSASEPEVANITAQKHSRRSSLPHRLISSLVPGNSTSATPRTRTASTQSSQRKKWRLSRRFSKTPIVDDVAIHEVAEPQDEQNRAQDPTAEVEGGKGKARENEIVDDSQSAPGASSSSAPLEDAPSTTSDSRLVEQVSDAASRPIRSFPIHPSEEDEDEVDIAPTTESIDPPPQTQGVPANQSEGLPSMFMPPLGPAGPQPSVGTTTQPPGRQFPPAGTLVVVQGVVHTTDVSRVSEANIALANNNNNSSNPSFVSDGNLEPPRIGRSPSLSPSSPQRSSSTPRDRLRNRLSGILPRPTSMLPSMPLMSEDSASIDHPTADYPQQLPFDAQSSTATSIGATGSSLGAAPPTSEVSNVNPGSLSPSSIDVLGTLLSVAAAATAASLLTGSSEPIFSSGLAPPPQSPPQSPPQATSDRPLSPTPTGDAGRMRHVWSSLRDRFGLRAPGMGAPGADESAGRPSPRDARELLLSEMARAFNLGLGVGSPPVVPGAVNASGPIAPAVEAEANNGGRNNDVPIVPPPGSFERFLIDLQSDLRVAFAQQSVPVDADDEDEGDLDNHEDEDETTENMTDVTSDSESYDTAASNIDDDMPDLQSISDEASTISDVHTARESPGPHDDNLGQGNDPHLDIRSAQGYDITATLPHSTHADTFSGEAGIGLGSQGASSGFPGAPTERLPSLSLSSGPPPSASSSAEPSTAAQDSSIETDMPFRIPRFSPGSPSRTEHTPINWWRLYRFPPITAPANRSTQASTTGQQGSTPQPLANSQGAQNAGAAPAAPSSIPSTPSGMADTEHATPDAELTGGVPSSDDNANGDEQRNVVVPVIVVGLQSVNAERQPPMPPHPHHHPHHHHHPHIHHHSPEFADENQTEGDLMDLDFGSESPIPPPMPTDLSEDTRQSRSRSWQSRAADAIRNLRPGRRAAAARQTALEPPGSRTFLIYVIGGYYPPDHQIITGGNLDSFEALWELAELLGQVKPPTVSKDEIDKSGLEVFKAESLEEYEKDGRVAANCVERCLICLDDYAPDEDLRVLSCKHAFHQGCVDRWLQTGRNNCPACRSKGVSDDASPSEPSAQSSNTTPQPATI